MYILKCAHFQCCQRPKNNIENKGSISRNSSNRSCCQLCISLTALTWWAGRPLALPHHVEHPPQAVQFGHRSSSAAHTKNSAVKSYSNHGVLLVLIYHRLLATDNTAWKHPRTSRFLQEYRQERKTRAGPRKKEITHDFRNFFFFKTRIKSPVYQEEHEGLPHNNLILIYFGLAESVVALKHRKLSAILDCHHHALAVLFEETEAKPVAKPFL